MVTDQTAAFAFMPDESGAATWQDACLGLDGVMSTPVGALTWLRGTTTAVPAGQRAFHVTIDFDAAIANSPSAEQEQVSDSVKIVREGRTPSGQPSS